MHHMNPYDPLQIYGMGGVLAAGQLGSGAILYLLGTDGLGRDIVSTILYGLRISGGVDHQPRRSARMVGLTAVSAPHIFASGSMCASCGSSTLQLTCDDPDRAHRHRHARPGVDRIILALIIANGRPMRGCARRCLDEANKPYMDATR